MNEKLYILLQSHLLLITFEFVQTNVAYFVKYTNSFSLFFIIFSSSRIRLSINTTFRRRWILCIGRQIVRSSVVPAVQHTSVGWYCVSVCSSGHAKPTRLWCHTVRNMTWRQSTHLHHKHIGGVTAALCISSLSWGRRRFTIDDEATAPYQVAAQQATIEYSMKRD